MLPRALDRRCRPRAHDQVISLQSLVMPGRRAARPYRAKGSSIPRLAGVGVVLLLALGGLAAYLASARHNHAGAPNTHQHTRLSSRALKGQNVGIVDFRAADGDDSFVAITIDHPIT